MTNCTKLIAFALTSVVGLAPTMALADDVSAINAADTGFMIAATALVLAGGHPETAFKVLAVSGLYALAGARQSARPFPVLALVVGGFTLGILLLSVQLLPFLEYLDQSLVGELRRAWSTNPSTLAPIVAITGVVPDFLGHPTRGAYVPVPNALGNISNYCEQQVYAGVAVWLLALVGVSACRTEWRPRFFAGAITPHRIKGIAASRLSMPDANRVPCPFNPETPFPIPFTCIEDE